MGITAAHCIQAAKLNSSRIHTRTILIREETEHEELIGVKRVWLHPLRDTVSYNKSAYYDIAVMELERRIEFDYEKFGDSPACLGEDLDISSQTAVLQGFGLQADETFGELLELQLKTITNDMCYEEFKKLSPKQKFNKIRIQNTLFEGITNQVLCTLTMCNGTDPNLKRRDKCDASGGDGGAPLYSLGVEGKDGEIKGQKLIGIHSGGLDEFVGAVLKREKFFYQNGGLEL